MPKWMFLTISTLKWHFSTMSTVHSLQTRVRVTSHAEDEVHSNLK